MSISQDASPRGGAGADCLTLWTDDADAPARIARMRAEGRISEAEAANLAHFAEHGWVVLPKAIEPALVDRFNADIDTVHHHPGKFIMTDRTGGPLTNRQTMKLSDTTPDRFEAYYDMYVNLQSSRDVCMHPSITRLLGLIFEAKPRAFQQILFQRSHGHRLHQDTAFVAVEEPLHMVATWIALEDVVEGSGELCYYDRSHKLPHHLFADGTKRYSAAADNMDDYVSALEKNCAPLEYRRFLAKKGDVFIWAADLVHGSHQRSLPEETTRRACVTHYCPVTSTPFFMRFFPENQNSEITEAGEFVSSCYVLPNHGEMIAPIRLP